MVGTFSRARNEAEDADSLVNRSKYSIDGIRSTAATSRLEQVATVGEILHDISSPPQFDVALVAIAIRRVYRLSAASTSFVASKKISTWLGSRSSTRELASPSYPFVNHCGKSETLPLGELASRAH